MTTPPKQRRGRPPLSKGTRERFRRDVLQVARSLFAQEGFDAVSMRKIAAEAGCSPMKLYGYFKDKRELLRLIWEDSLGRVLIDLKPVLASDKTAADRLRAFGVAYVHYWIDHPEEYRVVFMNEDAVAGPEDDYYVYQSNLLDRVDWVQAVVAEGLESGQFAGGKPAGYTQQFMCLLGGLAHMLITVPEFPWQEHDRLVRDSVNTFVRGMSFDEKGSETR